jgi:hypothetical protein
MTDELRDELDDLPGYDEGSFDDPTEPEPGIDVTADDQFDTTAPLDTDPQQELDDQHQNPFPSGPAPSVFYDPDDDLDDLEDATPTADTPSDDDAERPAERSDAEVAEDLSHGFEQTGQRCVTASVTGIVADFTNTEIPDESRVSEWAATHDTTVDGADGPVLTENGVRFGDIPQMLEAFGIPADIGHVDAAYPENWETIDGMINAGYGVIIPVDAAEYWPGYEDQPEAPHVIRVVDVDIDRGVAVLSDTGYPGGIGIEVSLELLDNAWAPTDYSLAYTEVTDFDPASAGIVPQPADATDPADVDLTTDVVSPDASSITFIEDADQFINPVIGAALIPIAPAVAFMLMRAFQAAAAARKS